MIQWTLVFYIFQEHSGAELILPTSAFSGTMKELATPAFNTDLFLAYCCKLFIKPQDQKNHLKLFVRYF